MNASELERLVDRELRALPTPSAPATLLPRVLAVTSGRERAAWHVQGWAAWPRRWPAAAILALVALAAGIGLVVAGLTGAPGAVPLEARAMLGRIAAAASFVHQASALMRLVWQLLFEPVAAYLLVLSLSFSLACAGLWTALNRVAPGGASRP